MIARRGSALSAARAWAPGGLGRVCRSSAASGHKRVLPQGPLSPLELSGFRFLAWMAVAAAVWGTVGCGGYAATVRDMNQALASGDLDRALREVDRALDVDPASGKVPAKINSTTTLLLLERGAISHALGQYERSAADLQYADQHLEVLSLTDDTGGSIGRFLFSDDSGLYTGAPYEKLMVNTLNMLNFMALGQWEAARVEARRMQVVRELLDAEAGEGPSKIPAICFYLAGAAFEGSGRPNEALRYYGEALDLHPFESLRGAVAQLAASSGFRPPSVAELLSAGAPPPPEGAGSVLVVAIVGRVPHRVAERIPIGLALTMVANERSRYAVSAEQRAQADMLAARGLLTWLNLPSLQERPARFERALVSVGGQGAPTDLASNLAVDAAGWFEQIRGPIVGTALTRMITRLLAGLAVQEATKAAGGNSGWAAVLGLAVQGALTAADTPDTRSWNALGARYFVARAHVAPGSYAVQVDFSGPGGTARAERTVEVLPGALVVLPISALQ